MLINSALKAFYPFWIIPPVLLPKLVLQDPLPLYKTNNAKNALWDTFPLPPKPIVFHAIHSMLTLLRVSVSWNLDAILAFMRNFQIGPAFCATMAKFLPSTENHAFLAI